MVFFTQPLDLSNTSCGMCSYSCEKIITLFLSKAYAIKNVHGLFKSIQIKLHLEYKLWHMVGRPGNYIYSQ